MEFYIKKSNLDKYGNGVFDNDEVIAIIRDLRGALKSNEQLGASNRLFKRLLMAAVFSFVLLLTATIGISYTIAVLTTNTQVRSDGALLAQGTTTSIATATSASLYGINKSEAGYCLTAAETFTIRDRVLAGRQVLVQLNDEDSNTHAVDQLIASGAVINDEAQKYCFFTPTSTTPMCLTRSDECTQERRRLTPLTPPTGKGDYILNMNFSR
jgi:hypothetical protein